LGGKLFLFLANHPSQSEEIQSILSDRKESCEPGPRLYAESMTTKGSKYEFRKASRSTALFLLQEIYFALSFPQRNFLTRSDTAVDAPPADARRFLGLDLDDERQLP
jgi:hypothetical protein